MEGIIFGLGCLVGCIVTGIIFRLYLVGTLRVDSSDPYDGPYLFLELNKDVDKVVRKTHVILKVKTEDYMPHK